MAWLFFLDWTKRLCIALALAHLQPHSREMQSRDLNPALAGSVLSLPCTCPLVTSLQAMPRPCLKAGLLQPSGPEEKLRWLGLRSLQHLEWGLGVPGREEGGGRSRRVEVEREGQGNRADPGDREASVPWTLTSRTGSPRSTHGTVGQVTR